ncbi:MAG TPA: hypothetical protein VLV78_01140 [Thermoanaerobaculia bacterium]|nr:hypothetical protein [Thermoanaerobaculia bacterium]
MINIHNGDAMAIVARRAGLPGEHIAFREALVTGPIPAPADWLAVRARFLADVSGEDLLRVSNGLFELEQSLNAASESSDEVVLWFEHDLFCLANFLYLLQRFRDRSNLSYVWCSGVLTQREVDELMRLSSARAPVTPSMFDIAARAWGAYTSSDPRLLNDVIASAGNEIAFLREGLRLHASRFPSTRNGLGSVEARILKLIAAGAVDFAMLFPQFDETGPRFGFGDIQILHALRTMAGRAVPLITLSEGKEVPPKATFGITPAGENVMNGSVDDLTVNDPDFWLGGVHVTKENIWRWDESRGEIIPNRSAGS